MFWHPLARRRQALGGTLAPRGQATPLRRGYRRLSFRMGKEKKRLTKRLKEFNLALVAELTKQITDQELQLSCVERLRSDLSASTEEAAMLRQEADGLRVAVQRWAQKAEQLEAEKAAVCARLLVAEADIGLLESQVGHSQAEVAQNPEMPKGEDTVIKEEHEQQNAAIDALGTVELRRQHRALVSKLLRVPMLEPPSTARNGEWAFSFPWNFIC